MRIVERDAFARIGMLLIKPSANGGPKKLGQRVADHQGLPDGPWSTTTGSTSARREETPSAARSMRRRLEKTHRRTSIWPSRKKKKLTQGDELPPACRRW